MESRESRELVAPAIPKRMSDTILEYARPMIERLPHDHTFVAAIDVHRVDGKTQVTAFGVCPEPWCCGPQARA
jgi:hypothetical protein